ncbi:hypothetical protein BKA81DRAFT_405874 [Phyllosticta paracitricarpa]|uniref:Uncharacterized protein n=2 Tax=Phyllosticta TaxID=121621 RepID=A0ABR1MLC9_9PEZI
MQFSTLIALLATTAAAAPFNSTIEARGLNETSALLPRGLNVTRIVEPRGLNDTSVLLPRGLNDTSILVGRSANVTVRSYNATKRGESATFPHVTIPKPVSGIFEGNKNIHALPNKTTNDVKRSYGSFGTATPRPLLPGKAPCVASSAIFVANSFVFKPKPTTNLNRDPTMPLLPLLPTRRKGKQTRTQPPRPRPVPAVAWTCGTDASSKFWALDHLKKSHRPDFPSSDTSREDFDVNGDGGGLCAVNTTTGSRAATATRCCRCLLRSAIAAEAIAALQMENCAPVARVATITASPAVSTATADDSPASSSPSSEPLEVSATAMTEHELPSLSGLGRGNTLISLWVATLFMTLFCDHV